MLASRSASELAYRAFNTKIHRMWRFSKIRHGDTEIEEVSLHLLLVDRISCFLVTPSRAQWSGAVYLADDTSFRLPEVSINCDTIVGLVQPRQLLGISLSILRTCELH